MGNVLGTHQTLGSYGGGLGYLLTVDNGPLDLDELVAEGLPTDNSDRSLETS